MGLSINIRQIDGMVVIVYLDDERIILRQLYIICGKCAQYAMDFTYSGLSVKFYQIHCLYCRQFNKINNFFGFNLIRTKKNV